jgi:PilZ domain
LDAHTSDLSMGGCYVDAMSPLPTGTEVELRLLKDGKTFRARTKVAHYSMGIGMGLLFTSMQPAQFSQLEKWFGGTESESQPARYALESDAEPAAGKKSTSRDRYVLEELLILMMRKALLSEDEGQPILKKLLR